MIRRAIDRLYKTSRGLEQGLDPDLASIDLVRAVSRRASEQLRGVLRGCWGSYLGRGVVIRHGTRLRIGRAVVVGSRVTIDALSRDGIDLGSHVTIDHGAILRGSGVIRHLGVGISVGPRTSIGAFNVLLGQGGIRIGSDCLLGPSVTIVSENHVYVDPTLPIREQGEVRAETVIGDDVWIGAGAVILGGAQIGSGAVIAAGAVVRGNVESLAIVGGIPARLIGRRGVPASADVPT